MRARLTFISAFLFASLLVLGCGSNSGGTSTVQSAAAAPNFSVTAGTYATVQTVALSSSTSGAQIYYTTNGSTPTASATLYSGPIAVYTSETVQAIAVAANFSASAVASAAYTISPSAGAPAFSLAAGRFTSAQPVTLSSNIAGAQIYYTTDGSTPTTSSTLYSGPITVSVSETIQAIVVAPGYTSPVISETFVIVTPAATPVFSVAAGTYTSTQSVALSSSSPGAAIYYTTNGSAPTTSSTLYSGPIAVSSSETIEAIAAGTNYSSSSVASAAYVINLPASAPVFSIAAATYTSSQNVALSSSTAGAQIYYTTNGSAPTTSSTLYSGPITVSNSETIKAIAAATNYSNSPVASAAYVINTVGLPFFSVPSGTYTASQSVTITAPGIGGTIYYTTDGSTPTTSSLMYSGPFKVSSSETVNAFAVTYSGNSPVATATYVINLLVPSAPVFSVASGTYTSVQMVSLSSNPGVPIYYTVNGGTPNSVSRPYQEPFAVSSSETVQAVATTTDGVSSPVSSAAYVIALPGSLQLSPESLMFFRPGDLYTTTLTNPTSGPVTINSIQITPNDWTQVSNCGSSLAANSSCIIAITAGQNYGQFLGTLSVSASDSSTAHAIPLLSDIRQITGGVVNLGNGVAGQGNGNYNSISGGVFQGQFGPYDIYEYSGTDIEGQVPAGLSITSCSTKATYSCSLDITYTPPIGTGSAYVTTNAPGEVYYVTDYGLTSTASFVFSPVAVSAGSTTVGGTISFVVPVENSSTQSLLFTAPTLSTGPLNNGDFSLPTNSIYSCQNLVAASSSGSYVPTCSVEVTFTPTALGTRATVLTLTESNGYSQQVLITGQGVTPSLTVTPSLSFGEQAIGTTSAPMTINVTAANQDGVSASFGSGGVLPGAFALTGPTTCAQGASSCQFSVTFTPPYVTPSGGTPYSATVTLTDTTTGYSTSTSLSGLGQ